MNILFIVQAVPVTIHQAGRLAYSFALAWGVYHCPENWEDSNAKISHLRIHDDYMYQVFLHASASTCNTYMKR